MCCLYCQFPVCCNILLWLFFVFVQVEVNRAAGLNDVGMVAWLVTLSTPECPDGRQAIIIANDITHQVKEMSLRVISACVHVCTVLYRY